MITNYIIDPSDPRYGKLGHIWNKYSVNDLISNEGYLHGNYYFIPPELVSSDFIYRRGWRVTSLKYYNESHDQWTNWVSCYAIRKRLNECCNLSIQDYYDLLILKSNNKLNRPRCSYCNSPLKFSERISQGYSMRGDQLDRDTLFCSDSCQAAYYGYLLNSESMSNGTHPIQIAAHDNQTIIKSSYYSFLGLNNSGIGILYIVDIDNEFSKFGITNNINQRIHMASSIGKINYSNLIILYEGTAEIAAKYEALIKLYRHSSEEWIPKSEKDSIIRLFNSISVDRLNTEITFNFNDYPKWE